MTAKPKIRVLVVDDSALVRQMLSEILSSDPLIEVVGTAADPYIARKKIKQLKPDVLTLDVEMPKMDGLTFLANLMRLHPLPVVMISSMTAKGAEVSLNALAMGAVDIVAKPREDLVNSLQAYSEEIITKVKAAVRANIYVIEKSVKARNIEQKLSADAVIAKQSTNHFNSTEKLIAIGASTGGTEAIKDILVQLPADAPGIVIAQHIPEAFSSAFAERMNLLSRMVVCEARDGDRVLCGHVYIAPGSQHLVIKRDGNHYVCQLHDGPPVNRHKPSVDVLFRSVAQCAGPNAIGIILTGMGDDGARGLKEMHEAGAPGIAQDEKSSVVWGMPGEAVKHGAVDHIVALEHISSKVLQYC